MHMRGRMEVLELSDGGILQGLGLLRFFGLGLKVKYFVFRA